MCKCAHDLGKVPFPLKKTLTHRNDTCKWTCCNLSWNEDVCPCSVESPTSQARTVDPSSNQRGHRGVMICKCCHKLGKVRFPLDKRRTHVDVDCKWTCYKVSWNENTCTSSMESPNKRAPTNAKASSKQHGHRCLIA